MVNKIEEFNSYKSKLEDYIKNQFKDYNAYDLSKLLTMGRYFTNDSVSYIYFLHSENTGLTKIGSTGNLLNRIKTIAGTLKNYTGVSHKLKLLGLIPIENSIIDISEKTIHKSLSEYNTYGEWFNIDVYSTLLESAKETIAIGNTLIVLDDSFDIYSDIGIDFMVSEYEAIKFIDEEYYISPLDKLFITENPLLNLYKKCRDYNIGFYFSKSKLTRNGVVSEIVGYSLDSENEDLFDVISLKKRNLNVEVIESVNDWLMMSNKK